MKKTFYVTFKVEARYEVAVTAENKEEAIKEARISFSDCDCGDFHDVDGEEIMVENEEGEFVWEK